MRGAMAMGLLGASPQPSAQSPLKVALADLGYNMDEPDTERRPGGGRSGLPWREVRPATLPDRELDRTELEHWRRVAQVARFVIRRNLIGFFVDTAIGAFADAMAGKDGMRPHLEPVHVGYNLTLNCGGPQVRVDNQSSATCIIGDPSAKGSYAGIASGASPANIRYWKNVRAHPSNALLDLADFAQNWQRTGLGPFVVTPNPTFGAMPGVQHQGFPRFAPSEWPGTPVPIPHALVPYVGSSTAPEGREVSNGAAPLPMPVGRPHGLVVTITGPRAEPVMRPRKPNLAEIRTPPAPGERERKGAVFKGQAGFAAFVVTSRLFNALTEGGDVVLALWDALPQGLKSARWREWKRDHPRSPYPFWLMARDLIDNWDRIDLDRAAKNLLLNHIEDMLWGRYFGMVSELRNAGWVIPKTNVVH